MGLFGKQHHYCPNCGKALYDDRIVMDRAKALCCSNECRDGWEMKYARSILGKEDADPKPPEV